MNNYKTEIKWAFIFSAMSLTWVALERALGFHTSRLEMQQLASTLILVPSLLIYFLALRDKRDHVYSGNMTRFAVSSGSLTSGEASEQLNLRSYMVQSVIGGLVTGLLFSALASCFIRSKSHAS